MKTTEVGEDSRLITVTSDPPADESTPERDGGVLKAHPLSTDAQTKPQSGIFILLGHEMSRIVKKIQESIFHSYLFRSALGEF